MGRQKERRQFRRRDCLMLFRCEGEGLRVNGYIVSLSLGGAGMMGTKKLPVEGTELLVTLRHPWNTIKLRSRVVWVKSAAKEPGLAEFGVEFLDNLHERQEQLADFFPRPNTI